MEQTDRWWLASAWLWLIVLANFLVAVVLVIALVRHLPTNTPLLVLTYALTSSALQIVCILAIFRWHRWGWWGLLVIGIATFFVNVVTGRGLLSLAGLAGVIITFLVLKGGGQLAAWPRLK